MKKKLNVNATQVAHDCIAYALLVELQETLYWRQRQQDALPMLVETMLRLLEREIPAEVFQRMVQSDFVAIMHHNIAACGATPYVTFEILNAR